MKPAWEAVNVHRAFGKKHVSQVAMARQGKLLLSLSDEGVNLHTLPALKLTCQANRSKAGTMLPRRLTLMAVAKAAGVTPCRAHAQSHRRRSDVHNAWQMVQVIIAI